MKLAEISIRRPVFISSLVILMLILGLVSLLKMSVDLFPDVTFPVIFIQTPYPGATPIDVEREVSKPIEDELASMSGLNKLTSQNMQSASIVILEYKLGTDIKDAEQQVRQRLGNIRRKLPIEIKEPIIRRFDPADQPVIRLAISSEIPSAELFDIVEDVIKPQFETLNGVGQVVIAGGRKREIQVLVDREKLQDRNISILQIAEKIKNTSKDVPIGKINSDEKETLIRASGEFESLDALKKVNVNFIGSDQAVILESLGEVKEGLEDQLSITSLMTKENNFARSPTLFIDVYRQSGSNTVKVVDSVIKKIDKVNELLKTKNISANIYSVRDNAKPIRLNIADVRESIIIGVLLCIIVVFFFLGNVRSTFITGMALPNSLLGGFIIMYAMGFSINIMTLLALSLAVGLLIDDAIVVRENIFRHMEMGKTAMKAAIEGTSEVSLAVLATTLVVIAVFGPIAFLDGIVGQFFKQFGLTVVFTMLISLFDAFTVAPMLSAYMAGKVHHDKEPKKGVINSLLNSFEKIQTWLENKYGNTIRWVLSHPIQTIATATIIFILSLGLVAFIPKNFLPPPDNGEFFVRLEKAQDANLESTYASSSKIEDYLKSFPEIDVISTVVGATDGTSQPNKAAIYVHLVPKKERTRTTNQVKDLVRPGLEQFSVEGKVSIVDVDIANSGQKPFNLNITGENMDQLSAYVEKLKARMEKIPGLVDVDTNFRSGKSEFLVSFDRAKTENLGVSTVTAGAELRARVEGAEAGAFRQNGREYNIRVRLNEKDRDLRKEFESTQVPNANFNMIPLSKIAVGKNSSGYSQINRQNKARFINIEGNLGSNGNLGTITNEVEELLLKNPEFKLPEGIGFSFQGQAEDFKDLLANMMIAMLLGVIFIYLVLASLYDSFVTPLTILIALPMGIVGALIALFMTQKSIDIFSLIGLIMLLGVVAKNSILLVDYTVVLMGQGMARTEALIKACQTRLRPILMTSLALIAGTIPIAIGLNEASAQRTSMGIAILGGLLSSTLLTLIVVPAAFGYIDDFRVWSLKKVQGLTGN